MQKLKVNIFYSWESDLPNNKNRSLIQDVLNKVKEIILSENINVTNVEIISDSRGECGTPELVSSIFNKIDSCDIFVGDISIINADCKCRMTPNPNVLLELGYASHAIGWNKLICIFNKEFAQIEDLPFDIRSRKPIVYNTQNEITLTKNKLMKDVVYSISNIINNTISDKNEYLMSKQTIDLAMQAIF